MRSTHHAAAATLLAAVFFAACADQDDRADDRAAPAADQTEQPAETLSHDGSAPDTTATELWAHLESEAYRDNWQLWPGTDRLYEGTEPHGMLLTTYVNDLASEALTDGGVQDLPEGSIIVKENYMPDSTFAAATVMMKVDGYNPDHDDWLFAKFDPEGGTEAFGRAAGCQACHEQAENAYIYTAIQR